MTQTIGRLVIALIGAVLAASIGCTSSKLNSTGPSASKCQVTVANADATIAAAGGTTGVAITAEPECAWTASTDAPWITSLAPSSGQGNSAVQVSAAPNADPVTRRGMVHIAATDVQITQAAAPCAFQVTPLSREVDASGGTTGVSISTNGACGWTAASTVSWIRITSGASGTGNGTATMAVDANSGPARSGVVTVAGQTVTVSQSSGQAPPCTYSISPTSQSFASGGGSGTVAINSANGCAWTAVSNAAWITFTGGAAGSGNGTINFTAAANAGAARSGTITVAGQTFTVSEALNCTYTINPTSKAFGLTGGTGTVQVTAPASCTWTAVSNNADWIKVTGGASGSGNGTVAYTAALAPGDDRSRSGTVTIAGQTFTVTEAKN